MLTSASAIMPVSGSKKTRVRPAVVSELKDSFSSVSAIVIKLTPSPASAGLIEAAADHETTKLIFARLDQRASARRAAPMTSLSGLICEPGIINDVEKATSIVFLGQRMRRDV